MPPCPSLSYTASSTDDGTAIFHLKDIDVKPFTLYAPFSGKQGVFGQDMLPYTHWLQQSHPHSLTADDGLVPVDAGPDGIPHISLFFMTDWRVESFRLCHSCKLYRITDRLRQR